VGKSIGIGIAVITILAIAFIGVLYWLPDFRAATRDVAVVILAFFQLIGTVLSIAILFALYYAIRAVERASRLSVLPRIDALSNKVDQLIDQTQAIAGKVQDTTNAVSGTTGYVTEQVVAPMIRASGLIAGIQAAVGYLARRDQE
jgi:ABC-type multidrug transport system fused ATPase/permease subunit